VKSLIGIYQLYRQVTWRQCLYWTAIAVGIGLFLVQTEIADAKFRGDMDLTWQPWVWTYSAIYSYILISPIIIYCCHQWPLGRASLVSTTSKLVLLYIPVTLLFISLMLITRQLAYLLISGDFMDEWNLVDRYLYEFPKSIGIYVGFAFITYTKIYYDSAQQEQLNAAKLQNELQYVRMQTLRSQLQPHFLFNTLNLISSMAYQDPDKADSIITRLSDLLRYSLATEQKPFVTLKEEMQAMTSYLEISELRFGEKMSTDIQIDPQTELLLIPAMLLQPLLENAVKYGIEPSEQEGKVALFSKVENKKLLITITNPWHQRRQQQESFGIGLKNAQNRLKLLYQDEASILLECENTQQVTLAITLPAQQLETSNDE
jgi:two-component system LytT family sensor kinase